MKHGNVRSNHSRTGFRSRTDNRLMSDYDVEKFGPGVESSTDTVRQEGEQVATTFQEETDCVVIRDSENVTVNITDTQGSLSLQVALQLAIALVLSIAIGTSGKAETIAQELFQRISTTQEAHLKMYVSHSYDVTVDVTDTQVTANVQALLQVLLALVAKLEVL